MTPNQKNNLKADLESALCLLKEIENDLRAVQNQVRAKAPIPPEESAVVLMNMQRVICDLPGVVMAAGMLRSTFGTRTNPNPNAYANTGPGEGFFHTLDAFFYDQWGEDE
jgi:hypothetical protein